MVLLQLLDLVEVGLAGGKLLVIFLIVFVIFESLYCTLDL